MTSDLPASAAPLPPVPRRRRWITIVLMLVIFAAGLAIGAGSMVLYTDYTSRYYRLNPDRMPERMLERLSKELNLSSEQVRQARPMVQEWWKGWQKARWQTYPIFKPELDRIDQNMQTILDERQKQVWQGYFGSIRRRYVPPASATQPDEAEDITTQAFGTADQ